MPGLLLSWAGKALARHAIGEDRDGPMRATVCPMRCGAWRLVLLDLAGGVAAARGWVGGVIHTFLSSMFSVASFCATCPHGVEKVAPRCICRTRYSKLAANSGTVNSKATKLTAPAAGARIETAAPQRARLPNRPAPDPTWQAARLRQRAWRAAAPTDQPGHREVCVSVGMLQKQAGLFDHRDEERVDRGGTPKACA